MVLLICSAPTFEVLKFTQDLGPVIVSIIALIISYKLTRNTLLVQEKQTKLMLDAQKETENRQEIYKKLNDFYGPLIQLREESNQLYNKFSEEYRKIDPHFATLTYLLNGKKFEGNEEILLKEIIKIGEKCENIIHSKAGLIDDSELRTILIPRASNHYLLLRLAHDGIIIGDSFKYTDLTFPRDLDSKLEARKKQLEDDLKHLNKKLL